MSYFQGRKKFQCLLIGDAEVGKTSLFNKIKDNEIKVEIEEQDDSTEWDQLIDSHGDWASKFIQTRDGESAEIQVMDTLSMEKYKPFMRQQSLDTLNPIVSELYRNADGFLLIYDVSDVYTFENVPNRIQDLRFYNKNAEIVLIGNKSDLEDSREVNFENGDDFAKANNLLFFETSAIQDCNIEEALIQITTRLLKKQCRCPYFCSIS